MIVGNWPIKGFAWWSWELSLTTFPGDVNVNIEYVHRNHQDRQNKSLKINIQGFFGKIIKLYCNGKTTAVVALK